MVLCYMNVVFFPGSSVFYLLVLSRSMSVLQEANNAFQAEDYTKALRLYRAVLAENPELSDSELTKVAQFNMAVAQRRIHAPPAASKKGVGTSLAIADNDRVQEILMPPTAVMYQVGMLINPALAKYLIVMCTLIMSFI